MTNNMQEKLILIKDLFARSKMSDFEKNAWKKIIPYMEDEELDEFIEIIKKEVED